MLTRKNRDNILSIHQISLKRELKKLKIAAKVRKRKVQIGEESVTKFSKPEKTSRLSSPLFKRHPYSSEFVLLCCVCLLISRPIFDQKNLENSGKAGIWKLTEFGSVLYFEVEREIRRIFSCAKNLIARSESPDVVSGIFNYSSCGSVAYPGDFLGC